MVTFPTRLKLRDVEETRASIKRRLQPPPEGFDPGRSIGWNMERLGQSEINVRRWYRSAGRPPPRTKPTGPHGAVEGLDRAAPGLLQAILTGIPESTIAREFGVSPQQLRGYVRNLLYSAERVSASSTA